MVFYEPQDVRSALLPINSICWFFGIGIIEYPVGYPRQSFSIVYSIAVFTFFVISAVVSYLTKFPSQIPSDSSTYRVDIINYSMAVILVCCNIFFSIIYSKVVRYIASYRCVAINIDGLTTVEIIVY